MSDKAGARQETGQRLVTLRSLLAHPCASVILTGSGTLLKNMLEIWGRRNSSNVMAVTWTVGELDLEFRRHNVGGSFGGLDSAEYLELNPNSKIPTINDNGRVLWESNTIVRYLSANYASGTLCPKEPYQRALAEQWMDWVKTTFYPAFHSVFFGLIRTPAENRNQQAIDQAIPASGKLLSIVERQLDGRSYLTGNDLTMADIPLGACIYRYFNLNIHRPSLPNVEAWYQRLCAREAYRQNVMIPFGRSVEEWLDLEEQGADQGLASSPGSAQ
ncbi:MAG: glutathione S-transferase family protein [bacterium]